MKTFVFTSPDGKEYEVDGPDDATEQQAFAVLQQQLPQESPRPKVVNQDPSYAAAITGNATLPQEQLDVMAGGDIGDVLAGTLYGMGSTARDTGARIKQVALGLLGPEGSRLAFTREYDKERADRAAFLKDQPQTFRGAASIGGTVQSVAQVPIPAASALGRVGVGTLFGGLQYVPEGDTTLGIPSDIANPVFGGTAALVAPPLLKGIAETGRFVGNTAKSVGRAATGVQDPFLPIKEQTRPIAQYLSGLRDVQAPQAKSAAEFAQIADDLQKATGIKPEALISQQYGSPRAAGAEAATSTVARLADRAFNERERIITKAFKVADRIGEGIKKGTVSPEKAGRILSANQTRAQDAAWEAADIGWKKDAQPIVDLFKSASRGKPAAVISDKNRLEFLENLKQTSAVTGQANDKVFSAIAKTQEAIAKTGRLTLDAAIKQRSSFSKLSSKGKFLGLDNPDDARKAAWGMAQATEADIMEAATKIGGSDIHKQAFQIAKANYAANVGKAKALEENIFGSLIGKSNASFEDFAKAAIKMPDSQYRAHLAALRAVNPNIDRQMGRFIFDKAKADSIVGPSAASTAARNDPRAFFESLSKNDKFIQTFPVKNQKEVRSLLKLMDRISDKSGGGGGGSAANVMSQSEQIAQVGATQDPGFLAKQVYRFLIGPTMLDSLYTEAGRKALLTVGQNTFKKVPPAAYAEAVNLLTSKEQDQK